MRTTKVLTAAVWLFAFGAMRSARADWPQFGHDATHSGYQSDVVGQDVAAIRFSKQFDTAAPATGDLLIHYDAPKADATGVYITLRDRPGTDIVYSVQKLDLAGNVLWTYPSDYHLIVSSGWEGSFSFAVGNGNVYVAGLYGVIHVISPSDGSFQYDIASYPVPSPAPPGLASGVVVSGPPAIDGAGKLYYVVRSTFTGSPPVSSHLAVANADGSIFGTVNFSALTGESSERPGLNCGPAVAPDGTIYVGSIRPGFPGALYRLLAINPDLSLKWIGNMAADPAHVGIVMDQSTSTPVVGPDGRVFYGGWNSNELSDGYLYSFSTAGDFLGQFPFGWDTTPVIYPDPADPNHYYLGEKLNRYASRRFYWVWIDPDTMSQVASWELVPSGTYELCVNAGVVDANLNTYILGEDGNFYKIPFLSSTATHIALGAPRNAAYTPAAMGPDGTIYALSDRGIYFVGNAM
jgi:hypothetical protein